MDNTVNDLVDVFTKADPRDAVIRQLVAALKPYTAKNAWYATTTKDEDGNYTSHFEYLGPRGVTANSIAAIEAAKAVQGK